MSKFLLGKKDPVVLSGVSFISEYETSAQLFVPSSVSVPAAVWAMDGNGPDPLVTNQGPDFQGVGDCTVVGACNADRTWNLLVNESNPIPSANEVVKEYFSMSGGQDTGLAETALLQHWQTKGLFGYKIAAFAPVDHTNITAIESSIANYGGCYFGVQLPESAQTQLNQGGSSTWSVVPGSPIEGGHCIWACGYDQASKLVQIVTWSQVVNVEYAWLAKYLDEAYAIIPQQFVEAGKGPTLDLASLQADLAQA